MDFEIESEPIKGGQPPSVCLDTLIEYAAGRLAYSVRKHALKIELSCVLYGEIEGKPGVPVKHIAPRSYERLVQAARVLLKERSLACTKEALHESVGFYENMLADPDVPAFARIKCRENLDRIKTAVTSSGKNRFGYGHGQEQVIDLNEIDIVIRKKILDDMRGNGNDNNSSSSQ